MRRVIQQGRILIYYNVINYSMNEQEQVVQSNQSSIYYTYGVNENGYIEKKSENDKDNSSKSNYDNIGTDSSYKESQI